MQFKSIIDVQVGDVIVDSGNRTTVTKTEFGPRSCKGKVHINERECYEGFAEVKVDS